MWKTGHSLIKQKMKELGAPLAGEMSGHMFFGGDWYGFDDALFAAARLLRYLAEQGGPLSRLLADLPATVATPELRVDCPDERKFDIVARAAQHFATKYSVSTLDGVRITFQEGWGLLRASNPQPVEVHPVEAGSRPHPSWKVIRTPSSVETEYLVAKCCAARATMSNFRSSGQSTRSSGVATVAGRSASSRESGPPCSAR